MNRRSEQLVALVDNYQQAHDKWVHDLDRPDPDETYWTAVEALLDGFAEVDIPNSCRTLSAAVDRLAAEVDAFDQRVDVKQLYPHEQFWLMRDALQSVREQMKPRDLPPLEPIDQLREQRVSDQQICTIYGFVDRRGRAMPWLVQQELDEPGSVLAMAEAIDGRTWEDPRAIQRREQEAADQQAAEAAKASVDGNVDTASALPDERQFRRRIGRLNRVGAARISSSLASCPETAFDLWRQRVPVAQAARMLALPEKEVSAHFDQFVQQRQSALEKGEDVSPTQVHGSDVPKRQHGRSSRTNLPTGSATNSNLRATNSPAS